MIALKKNPTTPWMTQMRRIRFDVTLTSELANVHPTDERLIEEFHPAWLGVPGNSRPP